MNKRYLLLAVVALLSGCSSQSQRMAQCEKKGVSHDACYLAESQRQQAINTAAMNAAYAQSARATSEGHSAKQHAQAAHKSTVADPMREATFSANGIKAFISNGFFEATINGKRATIKRFNAQAYEIRGAGYILSITLDENGITDASWNKTKGRDHGLLTVTQNP